MSSIRRGFELELAEEDLTLERKLASDEEKEALLTALGAWLDKQTQLRVPGPETGFHLKLLRAAEFNLDKAKELIEGYAKARTEAPEFFVQESAEMITDESLKANLMKICAVGAIDSNKPRVMIWQLGLSDHTQPEKSLKTLTSTVEFLAFSQVNQIHGVERIVDFASMSLKDLGDLGVFRMVKFVELVHEYPVIKLVRIHYVNAPAFITAAWETAQRRGGGKSTHAIFHASPSSLVKFINPDLLPTEYGGNAGSMNDMMMKWREFMDHKLAATEYWDSVEYLKEQPFQEL